ncbi:MAG TPA: mechanosensitive ion channel family protein [Acidimicrobiales bacterium]|nr:mechanosensitive ion channel family protein [Acidimicrobiales bacterium]
MLRIAAQQALGNVFAGLGLLVARPFRLDQRVGVRAGSLGGVFDATVREMSVVYVTLETDEGTPDPGANRDWATQVDGS